MTIDRRARGAFLSVLLVFCCTTLRAQCTTVAESLGGYPGTSSFVYATCMWDADGPGPAPNLLVCGGIFSNAGTVVSDRIAAVDPANGSWVGFGGGLGPNSEVQSLACLPNGNLVAAGFITLAGGVAVNNIAQWNGTAWAPLGSGITHSSYPQIRLAVLPNGDLVAAGFFNTAGGVAVNNVARWNGSAWTSMGGPFAAVNDLEVAPNGDLYLAGFTGLWRWNGTWAAVPGLSGNYRSLAVAPNGTIYVYGGTTLGVHRLVGSQVTSIGTPNAALFSSVEAMTVTSNGDLYVGGSFSSMSGVTAGRIARWNGTAWSALGSGLGTPPFTQCFSVTEIPASGIVAGGNFLTAGSTASENLARWDGATWSSFGGAANATVNVILAQPDGVLVAGGAFTSIGGVGASRIAKRVNGVWQELGSGLAGTIVSPGPYVNDVAVLLNGDLVACGSFLQAGGQTANSVARWNGTAWSPMGTGLLSNTGPGLGLCVATTLTGDVVVGGFFDRAGGVVVSNIARWDGNTWSALGSTTNPVDALLLRPDGSLVAAFSFYGLMSWNGTNWSNFGMNSGQSVSALANLDDGSLVAGGWFSSAGGVSAANVARWDGVSWHALGNGLPDAVVALRGLPGGDVLAACMPGFSTTRVWRWHGGSWSPVASLTGMDGTVETMALDSAGDVVIGGSFQSLGTVAASRLARLRSSCRAIAVDLPTACVRPAGPLALASVALPWLGGVALARGSHFAANGLVVAVAGVAATNIPLSLLDPSAGVNCSLLATPDVLELVAAPGGEAYWSLAIPLAPALLGVQVHHQMIELEFGVGALAGVYGSNALQWTLGSW